MAEEVVAGDALNVNRRGVVFVQAVEGRDVALLAWRVAGASLALHGELLDRSEGARLARPWPVGTLKSAGVLR